MATYDYSGAPAGAPAPSQANQGGSFVVYKKRMKVTDIIAWNATLTANAKITSADILQIIDVPAGFVFQGSAIYQVTPEGAADTVDLGVGGGDEMQDGASVNQTAGAAVLTLHGDDWGRDNVEGYFFSAADTIDLTAKADLTVADFIVYVWGIQLDLTT